MSQSPQPRRYARPILLLLLVAGTLLLWRLAPVELWLNASLAWVEAQGFLGIIAFTLAFIPACVVFFPDVLLNAAAGLVWGVALGTVIVSVARLGGATALFFLVRGVSGNWLVRKAEGDARFAAIARAVEEDGFKIALMLRLSPVFPIPLIHVALGLTNLSYRAFLLSTFVGLIPRTFVMAWIGAGARSLTALSSGPTAAILPPWAFWSGLLATIVVTWWLTLYARRTLRASAAFSG